jgi:hypothetical protein
MKMNEKMLTSLQKSFGMIEDKMLDILVMTRDADTQYGLINQRAHEVSSELNKLKHAVMESDKCEYCREAGLTDEPAKERIEIHVDMSSSPIKPRFEVWIDGVRYYNGTHNQCMIVHGYRTMYPGMTLDQMNDDAGGYLSEVK